MQLIILFFCRLNLAEIVHASLSSRANENKSQLSAPTIPGKRKVFKDIFHYQTLGTVFQHPSLVGEFVHSHGLFYQLKFDGNRGMSSFFNAQQLFMINQFRPAEPEPQFTLQLWTAQELSEIQTQLSGETCSVKQYIEL